MIVSGHGWSWNRAVFIEMLMIVSKRNRRKRYEMKLSQHVAMYSPACKKQCYQPTWISRESAKSGFQKESLWRFFGFCFRACISYINTSILYRSGFFVCVFALTTWVWPNNTKKESKWSWIWFPFHVLLFFLIYVNGFVLKSKWMGDKIKSRANLSFFGIGRSRKEVETQGRIFWKKLSKP